MIGLGGVQPQPWCERLDPRVKLTWLVAVSTLSVTLDSASSLTALCLVSAAGLSGLSLRGRNWMALAALLMAVAWGTLLSQALFYAYVPRTALFEIVPSVTIGNYDFPGLIVYREGAVYGLSQSLRFVAVTIAGLATSLSTSPERLLAALGRLKVPTSISFLTVAGLRTLPQILDDFRTLRQARALREHRVKRPSHRRFAWTDFALVGPLLAVSVRHAVNLATAVSSRGFDPTARRSYYPPMRLRWFETGAMVALALLLVALMALKSLYWLQTADVYYDPRLRGVYTFVRHWL